MFSHTKQEKSYKFWAFIPLIFFLTTYICAGLIFSYMDVADPFSRIPIQVILLIALLIAVLMAQGKVNLKLEVFSKSAGETGNMLMCLIFLSAGAFSEVTKAMGGVEATVNLGIDVMPIQFILVGIFIIAAFVSTAMGTSMGTIAAIGPVAIGLADQTAVSTVMAVSAVLSGAMFGDNLSMISDTTIAATRGAGCKMKDKFKMNFLIAFPAAIATMITYAIIGNDGVSTTSSLPYDLIKILPYVLVIIVAILGVNVFYVLMFGVFSAAVIGFATSSFTIIEFFQAFYKGMQGMFSILVIAILVKGVAGLVSYMGGMSWLMHKLTSNIKSRKGAEFSIASLTSLSDIAIANNTIAILVAAPLTRDIAKKHNIAPKRVASLLDIFSCVFQGILPHSPQVLFCISLLTTAAAAAAATSSTVIESVSPLALVLGAYYLGFLFIMAVITILTGFLMTKEEKDGTPLYTENGEVIDK